MIVMVEVVHPGPSFVMQQQMPLVRPNSKEKIANEFIAYRPFFDMVEMQYNEIKASLSPGEFASKLGQWPIIQILLSTIQFVAICC